MNLFSPRAPSSPNSLLLPPGIDATYDINDHTTRPPAEGDLVDDEMRQTHLPLPASRRSYRRVDEATFFSRTHLELSGPARYRRLPEQPSDGRAKQNKFR